LKKGCSFQPKSQNARNSTEIQIKGKKLIKQISRSS
jgi:hypothetical protein